MNYPKYVLKNKKLNKHKNVIVFRRNYLSIDDFIREDSRWVFQEEFVHHGTKCKFVFIINNPNFFSIFDFDRKTLKIKGRKDNFGVFLRIDEDKKVPFSINVNYGFLQLHLQCTGRSLAYDDGTGIKSTRQRMLVDQMNKDRKPKKNNQTAPYTNAGYAMTHPFKGGGMSPK